MLQRDSKHIYIILFWGVQTFVGLDLDWGKLVNASLL